MSVLWFLIAISMIMAAVAVIAFFRANRQGQFDDLERPALDLVYASEEFHIVDKLLDKGETRGNK